MTSKYSQHLVLVDINAYGHLRPGIGFVFDTLASDDTLFFTVLIPKFITAAANKEVKEKALPPDVASRLRVVGVGQRDIGFESRPEDVLSVPIRDAYQAILDGATTTCTATGNTFDYKGIPRPSAVFVDFGAIGVIPVLKEMSPGMTLFTIWPATVSNALCSVGPAECAGQYESKAQALLAPDDGSKPSQAAKDLVRELGLKVVTTGEGIKLHGYELWPQAGFDGLWPAQAILDSLAETEKAVDASIIFATRTFEPKSTEVLTEWWEGKLDKRVFFTGPQRAPTEYSPEDAANLPSSYQPIISFLNSHPARSVLLISFGTLFYPMQGWHVETLFKTLLQTRTPFIASKASAMYRPIDPVLEQAIADSGLGLIVDYIPQRHILPHPSIAAFLSHGGGSSLNESIFANVLSIFWPFRADQPYHANYMTTVLDCAWELIQVRTGDGAPPPYRGGKIEGTPDALAAEIKQVLEEVHGPVAERKRKNLEPVRQKLLEAVAPGGPTTTELQSLLKWTAARSEVLSKPSEAVQNGSRTDA